VHRLMYRPSLIALLAALAVAGCSSGSGSGFSVAPSLKHTPGAHDPAPRGKPTYRNGSFSSRAVKGTLHFEIALPPGYATSQKRYPVVYFLHGLPANAQTYNNIGGYANSLAATRHPAIVVGAQGARKGDTDPEWHDWGPGRNWETATQSELVSWIDHHYRTLAKRSGRAIIGASAGGYGATLIAIHHPETYQVIESWSGYFILTDPDGNPKKLDSKDADDYASAHASVPQLKARFAPFGKTFFGFYTGTKDPYPGFVKDNVTLSRELRAAGIPHVFRLYEGAHNSGFWAQHQDEWLGGAVDRLDPAS
jgi:enterochelin esterase-like enzyme